MTEATTDQLTWAEILALVTQLDDSGLSDAEVTTQGVSIRVSRHALPPGGTSPQQIPVAAPAPAAVPVAAPSAPATPEADEIPRGPEITATMLGTLYLRPSPDADPFVAVGDEVAADTTVAVIEVMKMMNTVVAGVSGRVAEICRPEGQMVEHGDVLFRLEAPA
jgi:acetyl-CoA carboxylase biotin carboxyl carrier protein